MMPATPLRPTTPSPPGAAVTTPRGLTSTSSVTRTPAAAVSVAAEASAAAEAEITEALAAMALALSPLSASELQTEEAVQARRRFAQASSQLGRMREAVRLLEQASAEKPERSDSRPRKAVRQQKQPSLRLQKQPSPRASAAASWASPASTPAQRQSHRSPRGTAAANMSSPPISVPDSQASLSSQENSGNLSWAIEEGEPPTPQPAARVAELPTAKADSRPQGRGDLGAGAFAEAGGGSPRRDGMVRRSIATAHKSGDPSAIQAASDLASAAGMTQAVEELQRFGAALDSARRRMKTAHRTKALEDIREALAEATPFECLRRTPQYQNLKTMAASSPGPGQYRRAAASSTQQPQQQQQQAVLPDYTGPWEWREVREAGGRISYVRVHAANSPPLDGAVAVSRGADVTAPVRLHGHASRVMSPGPHEYAVEEIPPSVYRPGTPRSFHQGAVSPTSPRAARGEDSSGGGGVGIGSAAFATVGRDQLGAQHARKHGSRPGPGSYGAVEIRSVVPPLDLSNGREEVAASASSRQHAQGQQQPQSPRSPSGVSIRGHFVWEEIVVDGQKGWGRVERS
jgi:hypothetical protein